MWHALDRRELFFLMIFVQAAYGFSSAETSLFVFAIFNPGSTT